MPSNRNIPIEQRFWSKVDTSGECWEWIASRYPNGYGQIARSRTSAKLRVTYAHRISWELHYGPIPEGMSVLHRCDNRACVNPAHLFLGTQLDNMRDMIAKGRGLQGEQHPMAKVDADDVRNIRTLVTAGATKASVARQYGITRAAVRRICARHTWQ